MNPENKLGGKIDQQGLNLFKHLYTINLKILTLTTVQCSVLFNGIPAQDTIFGKLTGVQPFSAN